MKRVLASALIAIAGCGGSGESTNSPASCGTPIGSAELRAGERYFRVDGRLQFLLGRNLTGSEGQMSSLIERTAAAGDKLVRVHLTHGRGMGIRSDGSVDPVWLASWERSLDAALRCGLYVIPVFGVWADFNNGTPNFGFANWRTNPLAANGEPSDLYVAGSAVQVAWLAWLGELAQRWQQRPNILAWEVFSELDLITGATEAGGVAFVRRAKTILRQADSKQRPVTASLAGLNEWASLSAGDLIDFVQIHPYGEQLDLLVIPATRQRLMQGPKAVLVGESGLSAAAPNGNTATTAPGGPISTRHASWAALVAGAMNGRALWWEDSYALFHQGIDFVQSYPDVERGVAKVAASRDLSSYMPLDLIFSGGEVPGAAAAIGSATAAVGWVRSVGCASPTYACSSMRSGVRVTVRVPGTHPSWTVRFLNTLTGEPTGQGQDLNRSANGVEIALPDFADDVAFTLDIR